jgi:tape measure domain-containing protein
VAVVANVAINVDAKQALTQINAVDSASRNLDKGLQGAAVGAKGLGAAIQAALGPLLAVSTAVTVVQKSLSTAFERGGAEQRLKNITDGAGEFQAAMALASDSAQKFGLTQTESTKALADVYSRLKGVGFGLQETGQIYQGFNAIAQQSGLAGEEAAGAFFQLSQALGKGKLNGDEFVIVAERMPQLLDAIAQTTGKSRGELTTMAQEGKITSQVLYDALSGAANASGNLSGKLTEQQKSFNNLRQVADQLLNSLGKVFAPVVVAGAQGLAAIGQKLSDWWGYIGTVIFPKVYEALQPVIQSLQAAFQDVDFDAIRVAVQNILINGFNVAIGVIGNFSKVLAFVIDGFKALSQNPVFQFIAEQVGRLAGHLGLTNDKVTQLKTEQQQVNTAAAESVKQYSSLPKPIEDSKEAAKQLKEEQQAITDAIQESGRQIEANAKMDQTIADQHSSIREAYLKAEMQINDVLLEQKERQLDGAKTQEQRIAIARDIYQLTVKQANLEYEATKAQIAAEVEKADLALMAADQKAKEVQIIVQLAAAQGKVNDSHYKALQLANEAVDLAAVQSGTVKVIAQQQERAAKAALQGKVNAAESAFQTNILAKNTNGAASAAQQFAGQMERGAAAATAAARGIGVVRTLEDMQASISTFQGSTTTASYTAEEAKALGIGPYASKTNPGAVGVRLAKGGLVTKPTIAMIGEGGEPEYVIPQSKADGFVSNYLMGKRGRAAIPAFAEGGFVGSSANVSIQTGPVTQMNGTNYVTTDDLSAAVQAGVNQTLSLLAGDSSVRRSLGLA